MTALQDVTGQRFGRLIVQARAPNAGRVKWLCVCDCGRQTVADSSKMRSGLVRSCGCARLELSFEARGTHGHTRGRAFTSEYRSWGCMKMRCTNPKRANYAYYGGRGIKVCDRWLNDFTAFLADMGPKPTPRHTIDRIDPDGHYEPDNCRWATLSEQRANRRAKGIAA